MYPNTQTRPFTANLPHTTFIYYSVQYTNKTPFSLCYCKKLLSIHEPNVATRKINKIYLIKPMGITCRPIVWFAPFASHVSLLAGSFGNLKRRTEGPRVLLHPNATRQTTCEARKAPITTPLHCIQHHLLVCFVDVTLRRLLKYSLKFRIKIIK